MYSLQNVKMKIGRLKDHLLGIGKKNVFYLVFLGKIL